MLASIRCYKAIVESEKGDVKREEKRKKGGREK